MERVKTLINKLQQQFDANENAQQLLYTVQLLAAELGSLEKIEEQGKVSVIMPTMHVVKESHQADIVETFETQIEEIVIEPIAEQIVVKNTIQPESTLVAQTTEKEQVVAETIKPIETTLLQKPEKITHTLLLDNADDVPTLAMRGGEINDIVQQTSKSLNDQLKEEKKEVAQTLVDTPVKDLRKAIGVNDKYVFINELFSGDEATYERSIKTINNFSVYPEAEQWIKRELYTKLCWLDNNKTVEQFYNLVKRRFS